MEASSQTPVQQADGAAADADNGVAQTRTKKAGFSAKFLRNLKLTPYFRPGDVIVAGDMNNTIGASLAGTYLDDGRADLPWSPDHEGILFGFLTGSDLQKIVEPRVDADGNAVVDASGAVVNDSFLALVSRGAAELVFAQGKATGEDDDDDWYLAMHDGRQRRLAAIEGTRRVDWCAQIFNLLADHGKPARRNLLIKLGKAAAAGKSWDQILADLAGILPATAPAYQSPKTGGDLKWLTETFARIAVGDEKSLGESSKRGVFYTAKDEDAARLGVPVGTVCAYPIWLKVAVVGCNVDPMDPAFMLESIAAKEAQVETPPSLFAEQVRRVLDARMNPSDPTSPPLYSRAAVTEKLGKSASSIQNYELLHDLVDEVKALIDCGDMSITFAVGERESAFVTWPKGQGRAVVPADKQRLILAHLVDQLAPDATGDKVRFRGPVAMKAGQKLRDAAVAGALHPVGHVDDDAPAPTTRPKTKAPAAASTGPAAQGAPPEPAKRAKSVVDVAAFRAAVESRIKALPERPTTPAKNDLGGYETAEIAASAAAAAKVDADLDALALARSVVLVVTGAEPIGVLDLWPAVRDAVAAAVVVAKPAGGSAAAPAQQSEEMFILNLACVAVEEMSAANTDKPEVTEKTTSGGRTPTPAQVEAANARLRTWSEEFKNDQSATLLEEYLLGRIVAAEQHAAK